jgi:hypothetical protein
MIKRLAWGLLIAGVGLVLWCCDHSDSGWGHDVRYDAHEVKYVLSCGQVDCVAESEEFYTAGSTYQIKECWWYCGYGYQGYDKSFVKLVFEKRAGGCWKLVSDNVGSPTCN